MMKFPYRKIPFSPSVAFPRRKSTLRPIIPVSLIFKESSIRYEALVDSGADHNIFPAEIGRKLGINIEDGRIEPVRGISGTSFNVYYHDVEIDIGGLRFKTLAGFADDLNNNQGILGQDGFFSLFKVRFSYKQEEIEIVSYS